MSLLDLFTIPLAGVAGLVLIGLAPAAAMKVFAEDVRAALVLPLGAAIVACASTLTLLGLPVRWAGVSLALVAAGGVFAVRLLVKPLARSLAAPAAVALIAFALASVPSLTDRTWDASSAGNGDLYYWVSESHAFLHGPAPAPSTEYPDRGMYELVTKEHNPFGIAFGLSMLSLASARQPVAVYSAFSSLVHVVLALVVYVLARTALRWRRSRSAAAAILVSGNAYLLFSTFFGWQAQLLITSFGLLALAGTYCALEQGPLPTFVALAGLGAAAGIATYGAVFAPFIIIGGVVIGAYSALHRDSGSRRRVLRSVAAISSLTLILAAVPIFRALLLAGSLVSASTQVSWCTHCQVGLPSEPLGLVPRIDWVRRESAAWSLLSLVVAAPLYVVGFLAARRDDGKAILLWGSAAVLAAIVVLGLFAPDPYLSMKFAGYSTPLLMLTMLAGWHTRSRTVARGAWVIVASLAGAMFVLSSVVVELGAVRSNLHAQAMAGLGDASRRLPVGATVRVDVKDAWHQSWALYYLRDRPLLIRHPQYFVPPSIVTAQKSSRRTTRYVLARRPAGRVLWRGGGVFLSAAGNVESTS